MVEKIPTPILCNCGCYINFVITEEGVKEARFFPCRQDCPVIIVIQDTLKELGKELEWRMQ